MLAVIATIGSIIMAFIVLMVRLRRAKQPTSFKQIILPRLFMSTGFFMFLYPPTHISLAYAIESLITGMIFSIPLILTSKFEIRNNEIFLKPSKAFIFILLGLFVIRLGAKVYIGDLVSIYETGALFYILAVGMIFPWRIAMAVRFKQLHRTISGETTV